MGIFKAFGGRGVVTESVDQLAQRQAAGDLVVDVRQGWEYARGHVPGAISIPLLQLGARASELPADRSIHVICATGHRSWLASRMLHSAGVESSSVAGGTSAWRRQGLPLEKEDGVGRSADRAGTDGGKANISVAKEVSSNTHERRRKVQEVNIDQFAAAHADGAYVVDVREPHEYEKGHVPGARLIPLAQVPSKLAELPKDRPVHVICASGGRSYTAAQHMARAGIDARSVAGGTTAWTKRGRPVVTGRGER